MRKTAWILALVLMLAISAFPASAGVAEFSYTELEDGTAEITRYNGSSDEVIFPERLYGLTVTKINNTVFPYSSFGRPYTKIVIPATVTEVGTAFWDCSNVIAYEISGESAAFATIDGVLFRKAEKELVAYPGGKDGEIYVIPEGIRSIGSRAFPSYRSGNLKEIVLPGTLEKIGEEAFCMLEMESITLPANVKEIAVNPFCYCDSLAAVYVDQANEVFYDIDGVVFSKETNSVVLCPAGKTADTYTIPDGIQVIGEFAFRSCEFQTVIIPDTVERIEANAFTYARLTSVTIPDGVKYIGSEAFRYCRQLEEVTIPASVETIEWSAFADCGSVVFYVPHGSAAVDYCVDNGYQYKFTDDSGNSENTDWLFA